MPSHKYLYFLFFIYASNCILQFYYKFVFIYAFNAYVYICLHMLLLICVYLHFYNIKLPTSVYIQYSICKMYIYISYI